MKGRIIAFIVLDSLLTLALVGWFVVTRISEIPQSMKQVVVPGSSELELSAGDHVVCWEHWSEVDGKSYSMSPLPMPKFDCSLRAKDGAPVKLAEVWGKSNYTWFGRRGVAILSFTIDRPGVYAFSAKTDRETVLAVGPAFGRKIVMTVLGGLGIAFVMAGMTVGVVLLLKR